MAIMKMNLLFHKEFIEICKLFYSFDRKCPTATFRKSLPLAVTLQSLGMRNHVDLLVASAFSIYFYFYCLHRRVPHKQTFTGPHQTSTFYSSSSNKVRKVSRRGKSIISQQAKLLAPSGVAWWLPPGAMTVPDFPALICTQ